MTEKISRVNLMLGLIFLSILVLYPVLIKADSGEVELEVKKQVRNLTRGDTRWYKAITAQPSDVLLFRIETKSIGQVRAEDIMVRDVLPQDIIYLGELKIDYSSKTGNVSTEAINIGDLEPNGWRVISFKAQVASSDNFKVRKTNLINTALVYNEEVSETATCKVTVIKKTAPEIPTEVETGITSGILNSILLPLGIAILGVWIFRSKLVGLDKWVEERKRGISEYRTKKKLKKEIDQLKRKGTL